MSQLAQTFITVFATGTVFFNIVSLFLLLIIIVGIVKPKNKKVQKVKALIADNYVIIVLFVSALATAGSLTLSEIVNFLPCKLCWYQRIAMYPVAFISFAALLTNDTKIKKYILSLSIIGSLIAIYHILLQLFPAAFQCNDEVAKCSAVQFTQFGYVTIPVMALSSFIVIILACLVKSSKEK